jgi:hypothetical protein
MRYLILLSILSWMGSLTVKAQNTFPSSGSVGIGTTNPQQKLVVSNNDAEGLEVYLQQPVGTVGLQSYNRSINAYSKMQFDASQFSFMYGNMDIGTTTPEVKLQVVGESRFNGAGWFSRSSNGTLSDALYLGQLLGHDAPCVQISTSDDGGWNRAKWLSNRWGHALTFQRQSPTGIKNMFELGGGEGDGHCLSIFSDEGTTQKISFSSEGNSWIQGNVGIGTTNPQGYKLAVNGDAIFTKVKVKEYGSWADYVFEPNYKLPSLKEVEQFIKQHKHLPEVPSAGEVEKNGLDLGDNQAVLLKKIEELILYAIESDKKNKKLEEKNQQLEERLKRLEEKLK